jgi:mannose-6-phosphate isomerase
VDGSVTISVGEQNITLRGTESVLHAGDATSVTITGAGEVYIARYV